MISNNSPELSATDKAIILEHAFAGAGVGIIKHGGDRDGEMLISALYDIIYNQLKDGCGVE